MYLFVGAAVYAYVSGSRLTKWSTMDKVYFAFITITTVGFGDLVPGSDTFFAILSLIYMLLGLSLTGIVFGRLTMAADQILTHLAQPPAESTTTTDDATAGSAHAASHHLKHS